MLSPSHSIYPTQHKKTSSHKMLATQDTVGVVRESSLVPRLSVGGDTRLEGGG